MATTLFPKPWSAPLDPTNPTTLTTLLDRSGPGGVVKNSTGGDLIIGVAKSTTVQPSSSIMIHTPSQTTMSLCSLVAKSANFKRKHLLLSTALYAAMGDAYPFALTFPISPLDMSTAPTEYSAMVVGTRSESCNRVHVMIYTKDTNVRTFFSKIRPYFHDSIPFDVICETNRLTEEQQQQAQKAFREYEDKGHCGHSREDIINILRHEYSNSTNDKLKMYHVRTTRDCQKSEFYLLNVQSLSERIVFGRGFPWLVMTLAKNVTADIKVSSWILPVWYDALQIGTPSPLSPGTPSESFSLNYKNGANDLLGIFQTIIVRVLRVFTSSVICVQDMAKYVEKRVTNILGCAKKDAFFEKTKCYIDDAMTLFRQFLDTLENKKDLEDDETFIRICKIRLNLLPFLELKVRELHVACDTIQKTQQCFDGWGKDRCHNIRYVSSSLVARERLRPVVEETLGKTDDATILNHIRTQRDVDVEEFFTLSTSLYTYRRMTDFGLSELDVAEVEQEICELMEWAKERGRKASTQSERDTIALWAVDVFRQFKKTLMHSEAVLYRMMNKSQKTRDQELRKKLKDARKKVQDIFAGITDVQLQLGGVPDEDVVISLPAANGIHGQLVCAPEHGQRVGEVALTTFLGRMAGSVCTTSPTSLMV